MLNRRVEQLEKEKEIVCKGTENDIQLKCNECDFEATKGSELILHLCEHHGWPQDRNPEDWDMSYGVRYCTMCDYEAENGYEFEGHKWSEHEEEYDELNTVMDEEVKANSKADSIQFSCNHCTEKFERMNSLMKHKKTEHREEISICRNAGGCMYGDSCWYNHDSTLE